MEENRNGKEVMKITVTGGTGFIGGHLVRFLVKNGHSVTVLTRSRDKAQQFDWYHNVALIEGNYHQDAVAIAEKIGNPDILIHLAWPHVSKPKESAHFSEYLFGEARFLTVLIGQGLRRLVVAGTCFEYGLKTGELDESTPAAPVTFYGLAKDSLRRYLELLVSSDSVRISWVRIFYLYGRGRKDQSLIPQLENAILTGAKQFDMSKGDQVRDFLEVENAAEYICRIACHSTHSGIINCCSGTPITVKALVEKRIREMGGKIQLNLGAYPYPDYEPMSFWGATQKLRNLLNNE